MVHICLMLPQREAWVQAPSPSLPWAAGSWTGLETWEGMMPSRGHEVTGMRTVRGGAEERTIWPRRTGERAPGVLRCSEVTVHELVRSAGRLTRLVCVLGGSLANAAEASGRLPLSRAAQTGTDRCQLDRVVEDGRCRRRKQGQSPAQRSEGSGGGGGAALKKGIWRRLTGRGTFTERVAAGSVVGRGGPE